MGGACIVVADARSARFFAIEAGAAPRGRYELVERVRIANADPQESGQGTSGGPRTESNTNRQAGPVHPMGAQRDRHRLEHRRRFGREIALQAAQLTSGWKCGTLMLIAEPGMLGLTRDSLREALPPGVSFTELARDYAHLDAAELGGKLDLSSLFAGH